MLVLILFLVAVFFSEVQPLMKRKDKKKELITVIILLIIGTTMSVLFIMDVKQISSLEFIESLLIKYKLAYKP